MSRRDDRGGGGRGEGGGRGPPPDITKMVSLKVDGLSHRSTIEDLESLFEKYGRIGDVYIPKDYRTKESRGFGFVRFYSKNDAEDAIDALDGRKYDGRELSVQYARYDRPDERRGGGGRGGRDSYRDRSRSRSRGRRDRSRSGGRRDRDDSRDRGRRDDSRDRGRRDRSDSRDNRRRRHSSDRSDD